MTSVQPRCTALLLALLSPKPLAAQQTGTAPLVPSQLTGPPPAQIASAHTIFLTSAGADPNFPIDSTRAYNDVYAQLRAWGHYQLVPSAEQADLVLELHGVAPVTGVYGDGTTTTSYTTPAFQLNIVDPKAARSIWTITSPVSVAGSGKKYDRWVTLSESNLVSRLQVLAGQPLSTTQTADLTTVPKYHGKTIAIVAAVAIVGIGVGGGLLLHHEFENGLADQKAQADAFCKANNIPLAQCAGG